MKKDKLIVLMISAGCLVLLGGCGKISPGMSSKNMVNKNCANIAKILEDKGFDNISTETLQRSKADYTLVDGQIDSVIIDGTEDFEAEDKFKANAPVIITYISRPEENRKERRGFDTKTNSFVDLQYYRFALPDYVEINELTKNSGSCSIMNAAGEEEDATLDIFTAEYGNEVFGYSSLDENKEDWIEDYLAGDRDKFKLLNTKNFESGDGMVKGISFDYVYTSAGLWHEGVLAVVPNEEEMLIFELAMPDTSEALYKVDLENIATSVIEYRNIVTIADTDFVIPFGWEPGIELTQEQRAELAELHPEFSYTDTFILDPNNAGHDSPSIVGALSGGNDLFYPLTYDNIEDDIHSLITGLYWFLNVDDASYETVGDLKGIRTIIPESGNFLYMFIGLTPDNDMIYLILGDEDNDRENNIDNQEIFTKFLSTGRPHYK